MKIDLFPDLCVRGEIKKTSWAVFFFPSSMGGDEGEGEINQSEPDTKTTKGGIIYIIPPFV